MIKSSTLFLFEITPQILLHGKLDDLRLKISCPAIVCQNVHHDGIAGFQFADERVKCFQIGHANAVDALDQIAFGQRVVAV